MKLLLLGSISVLSDTSELQRAAFNHAFQEAGLDWHWPRAEYCEMLQGSGGRDRIAEYAADKGVAFDFAALHAHKTKIFQDALRRTALEMRPLTAQILSAARESGIAVGLVSSTAAESVDAVLASFGGAEALGLSFVISGADGHVAKPSPAPYLAALARAGISGANTIAVEDNVPGMEAAQAAGIRCYVYPNENTVSHDFGTAPHLRELTLAQAA